MRAAEGHRAGEGGFGIAGPGALWAELASVGDHLLAVNASPARLGRCLGNRGRREEIKERACLHPGCGVWGGLGSMVYLHSRR